MTATFFPVAFGLEGGDVALAKSSLGDGGFVLADSDRFVHESFSTHDFSQRQADASRKFRKIIRTVQYLIGFAPFAPVERVLEFRVFIAQRTCPVQKGTPQSIQREAWSLRSWLFSVCSTWLKSVIRSCIGR